VHVQNLVSVVSTVQKIGKCKTVMLRISYICTRCAILMIVTDFEDMSSSM
jgi:hypothetical protein